MVVAYFQSNQYVQDLNDFRVNIKIFLFILPQKLKHIRQQNSINVSFNITLVIEPI